jgi:hypothetical protein
VPIPKSGRRSAATVRESYVMEPFSCSRVEYAQTVWTTLGHAAVRQPAEAVDEIMVPENGRFFRKFSPRGNRIDPECSS